jgi:hypothetical protein
MITRGQARVTLLEYETKRLKASTAGVPITDIRPDVPMYGVPESEEHWYCFPGSERCVIGSGRVVAISKATGRVVFDGFYGE